MQRLSQRQLSEPSFEVPVTMNCPDYSAALATDDEGYAWVYLYAVWPDLAIMITVSRNGADSMEYDNWAFDAIRSLTRGAKKVDRSSAT